MESIIPIIMDELISRFDNYGFIHTKEESTEKLPSIPSNSS
jgi:hypothetical protein